MEGHEKDMSMGPLTLEEIIQRNEALGCEWFDKRNSARVLECNDLRWSQRVYPSAGGTFFIESRGYIYGPRAYRVCFAANDGHVESVQSDGTVWEFDSRTAAHKKADHAAALGVLVGILARPYKAPAEPISEPVSEAVSEPISEASSGPEIQPEIPTLAEAIEKVGAKLLAVAARDSDDATIVLAFVPKAVQPWVTWMYGEQRGDLFWGHYWHSGEDARRDFDKRVKDAS